MNNKSFIYLVVGFLVFGGALGGAFIGGIAIGSSDDDSPAVATSNLLPIPNAQQTQTSQGGFDRAGSLSPEELSQLRQQFQGADGQFRPGLFQGSTSGQFGPEHDGSSFAGITPMTGTIEKVEGNAVTIGTSDGQLITFVADETEIRNLGSISISDLVQGMTIAVIGERGDDGVVQAGSILITPQGAGTDFNGRLFSFGDRQHNQQNPN